MKRLLLAFGSVTAVTVATAGILTYPHVGKATATASTTASSSPAATAVVTRRDVTTVDSFAGTLGYADPRTIKAGGGGTITSLVGDGTSVIRGTSVYGIDGHPVVALYGPLPLYRGLQHGVSDGPDVRQLESNLTALGYGDGLTVDDTWTSVTTAAVESWQADRGVEKTGRVSPADTVMIAGPARVAAHSASIGDRVGPGLAVLDLTGQARTVSFDLPAEKVQDVRAGQRVDIKLPDASVVHGVVQIVSRVTAQRGPTNDTQLVLPVTVAVTATTTTATTATARYDRAAVEVDVSRVLRSGALTVPIEALVALREGGYAVEVVRGGTRTLVAVTTGEYGADIVAISKGVAAGDTVVVPS